MSKIKVAYIGDSPFIFSGFGVVARAIMSRWPMDEFEVSVLGAMHRVIPSDISPYNMYYPVPANDPLGFRCSVDFLQQADPDVIFFLGDPGTLRNRFGTLAVTGKLLPAVTYFPIEGSPLNPHVVTQVSIVKEPVTYTKWGRDVLMEYGHAVDYVYHGADHAPFRRYDEETRMQLKEIVGWGDKFIIGMVGVNKRTNRQPAVLGMARQLKERIGPKFMVYLHCEEKGDGHIGGWELGWMIKEFGVEDVVTLKPAQSGRKFVGRPRSGDLKELLNLPLPVEEEQELENLSKLDFISMMNLFDVYIDPASAHGFNLPAIEAMACGVPVITTDDGFARSEIYGESAVMMQPSAVDFWHTGAQLPLVSCTEMAEAVLYLYEDKVEREMWIARGLKLAGSLSWDTTASLFEEKIKSCYALAAELNKTGVNVIPSTHLTP